MMKPFITPSNFHKFCTTNEKHICGEIRKPVVEFPTLTGTPSRAGGVIPLKITASLL